MNGANDHEIHFKEDIGASKAILVERNGVTAALTLIRIAYYDSALDQQSTIAPFGSALGTATARLARWDNVIGTADFFAWARGDGLKTGFSVKSLSGLPDPTTVGFDPATTYFVIVLRLDLVAGVGSVVDEGGAITGSRDVGTVEFRDVGGSTRWWIPPLRAYEETGRRRSYTLKHRHVTVSGQRYLLYGVPYNVLMGATLPLVLDP